MWLKRLSTSGQTRGHAKIFDFGLASTRVIAVIAEDVQQLVKLVCSRTVIMLRFERRDRKVATSASLAVLCSVLLFVTCSLHAAPFAAQSSPDRTDSPEQSRKLATQIKTITGCLQKGYEPDEFQITGEDGKVWGLRSSAVKLDGDLGHKVTVSGLITHELKPGETKAASGKQESGDLRVTNLTMVSKTCGK